MAPPSSGRYVQKMKDVNLSILPFPDAREFFGRTSIPLRKYYVFRGLNYSKYRVFRTKKKIFLKAEF